MTSNVSDDMCLSTPSQRTKFNVPRARRDKGRMQATPRDLATLTWIAEQYVINFEHLRRLLARQPGKPPREPNILGAATTADQIRRWRREPYVEAEKLTMGDPIWIWLTRFGLQRLALDYLPYTPKLPALPHLNAVNAVRFLLEDRLGASLQWKSERTLRAERGAPTRGTHQVHLPDAVALPDPGRPTLEIAIEVELSAKSLERLSAILHELTTHYAGAWYFVTPETSPHLLRALETCDETRRRLIRLYSLTGDEIRGRG